MAESNIKKILIEPDGVKISVILPVYNVETWVGECIESLKKQRQDGLEFIFVDDCSTDNSMRAVENWAAEDERVRILRNKENSGAGPSRNAGIEAARGEYLSFIDPDDWISSDFYERLYSKAEECNCDIIKGVRARIADCRNIKAINPGEADSHLNIRIIKRKKSNNPLYNTFIYEHQTAIFKRTLFNDDDTLYGLTRNAQDVTFLLKICYDTEDIEVIDDAVYYYRQRAGAATSEYTYRRAMSELRALDETIDFLLEKEPSPVHASYLCNRTARYLSDYYFAEQAGEISDEEKESFVGELDEILKKSGHRDKLLYRLPELEVLFRLGYTIPVEGIIGGRQFRDSVERWAEFLSTHKDYNTRQYFKRLAYAIGQSIGVIYRSGKLKEESLKDDFKFYMEQVSDISLKGKAITAAYFFITWCAR